MPQSPTGPMRLVARFAAHHHPAASERAHYAEVARANGVDYYDVRASGLLADERQLDMRQMVHNETLKDEAMHKASDWHYMSGADWVQYVEPLFHWHRPALRSRPTLFVEFGSGVGAFSRILLREFPLSAGVGLTIGAREVRVARQLMRSYEESGRFVSAQWDMFERPLRARFAPLVGKADFVFLPGSLLFAPTLQHAHAALQNALQLLRPGGHVAANTIPEVEVGRGSGKIVLPRRFFLAEATPPAHPAHWGGVRRSLGCGCFELARMVTGGESLLAPVTRFTSARHAEAHFHLRGRLFIDLAKRRNVTTVREHAACDSCPSQIIRSAHKMSSSAAAA